MDTVNIQQPKSKHKVTIISIVFLFILFFAGSLVWAHTYTDRIGPNVRVGELDLSGLTREQALQLIQESIDPFFTEGVTITVEKQKRRLPLSTLVTTDLIEYVTFDIDGLISEAMRISHGDNLVNNLYTLFQMVVTPRALTFDVELSQTDLKESIYSTFPETETLAQEPRFVFLTSLQGWQAQISPGSSGREFAFDDFFEELKNSLQKLEDPSLVLEVVEKSPQMSQEEAQQQGSVATKIVNSGPFTLTHQKEEGGYERTWVWSQRDISTMLKPTQDGIAIDTDALETLLEPIGSVVEQPSRDARLEIENGRVSNFVTSREGITLDKKQILESLRDHLDLDPEERRTVIIAIATIVDEPKVKTGDVNDLGITEILGSGTSSYRGSPSNRRRNIQNGVDLLNGLLIAPGQTFSLVEALKPFTFENGYLPELVIKGDKIKPELGGGLCQIGTTTFRSVMNSGLEVTERRNHSLVVSYYNDLTNGLPGTDATIYEPYPDFKFTNDTEHHILFQAENLTDTQELRFSMWGTSDGRIGSYKPPVVSRWIPVGDTKYIETLDLEPGEEKCQSAHIGADASFEYSVVRQNGEVERTVFESHYRPLPKICLVGVEKLSSEEEGDEGQGTGGEEEVEKEDEE